MLQASRNVHAEQIADERADLFLEYYEIKAGGKQRPPKINTETSQL